jgi:predicted Ser/Thr protein kinase
MAVGTTGPTRGTAPVFGREEVVGEILRVLDGAREGVGQGLLLLGPSGIGKSHLLRVAIDRGRERGYRILTGRALPEDLPAPLTLIRGMLSSEREPAVEAPSARAETSPAGDLPMYLAPFLSSETPAPTTSAASRARRSVRNPRSIASSSRPASGRARPSDWVGRN